MKTKLMIVLAAAVIVAPVSAQFGGLGKMLGGGSGGSVSTSDGTAFLTNATRSTKNVMIATSLLAQAVTDRGQLSGRKAQIDALTNAQDIKELDAHRADLTSDLGVLNGRADLAGDLSNAYQAGNAQQKKVIGTAVANLAIGIMRNTQLVGQAPGIVKGVGSNPQLMSRMGQFKTAAGLLGMQAKGLGGIASTIPKLLSVAKVKGPAASETSEPQPIVL